LNSINNIKYMHHEQKLSKYPRNKIVDFEQNKQTKKYILVLFA